MAYFDFPTLEHAIISAIHIHAHVAGVLHPFTITPFSMMNHSTTLAIQSWTLYATSIAVIILRHIFRRKTLGRFTRFQADDWLMMLVLFPYTASIISANQVWTAQSAKSRKYRYVLEETQTITTWLVKACLLILYWRILPTRTNLLKRRTLQGISAFCCLSFIFVQVSLLLWCHPWALSTKNAHFTAYNTLTLALSILTTILVMILPIPFIPTPRLTLLILLLVLSTLVLASGIIARVSILQHKLYMLWYTAESSLSILFANLPFLSSLVVTAAPARIRSTLQLSQWPRSRQGRFAYADAEPAPRTARLNSMASTIMEITSPVDVEKADGWSEEAVGTARGSVVCETEHSGDDGVHGEVCPALPSPSLTRPGTRDGPSVPKTRLSGGLAEMGALDSQDTTQGWPIYWR